MLVSPFISTAPRPGKVEVDLTATSTLVVNLFRTLVLGIFACGMLFPTVSLELVVEEVVLASVDSLHLPEVVIRMLKETDLG